MNEITEIEQASSLLEDVDTLHTRVMARITEIEQQTEALQNEREELERAFPMAAPEDPALVADEQPATKPRAPRKPRAKAASKKAPRKRTAKKPAKPRKRVEKAGTRADQVLAILEKVKPNPVRAPEVILRIWKDDPPKSAQSAVAGILSKLVADGKAKKVGRGEYVAK
jgi:hypothetical protein